MTIIELSFPDGKTRSLKFNNFAIQEFWNKIDLTRYNQTANYAMIWAGLLGYYYQEDMPIDFKWADVVDVTDSLSTEKINEISEIMAGTKLFKKGVEQIENALSETIDEKKSELLENSENQ